MTHNESWSKALAAVLDSQTLSITRVYVETEDDLIIEVRKTTHSKSESVETVKEEAVKEPTRADKVEAIQNHLRSQGITSGKWFTQANAVTDYTVNKCFAAVAGHPMSQRRREDLLNSIVSQNGVSPVITRNRDLDW